MLAVLGAVAVASCGGSSSKSTTTTSTTHTGSTTSTGGHKGAPPLQQVVAHVKGATPGNSASASPGTPVVVIVHVPQADASKPLEIALDRTGPTTFTATSTVLGTPLHQTSVIHESGANAQITSVRWKCAFPKETFCPVHVAASSPTHVKLSIPKYPGAVELTVLLALPGAVKTPTLLPLGLPAPGSADQATVQVTAVAPKTAGKTPTPPAPSSSATAVPGSTINVAVRLASGSPAQGTLRIAIPQTSGHSIVVQAGGTAASPASTATVMSSSGNLRISSVVWGCQLPPATFCPLQSIHTTGTGLVITLPTPRIPVSLSLLTDKG